MFNIYSHFITSILCVLTIAHSDNLLLYDEFQFSFDLLNANDWDLYHITSNNKEQTQYHGRRLFETYYDGYNGDNEYASKCTQRIPIIFKYLCVDWSTANGFVFHYKSNLHHSKNNKHDTNWFHSSRNEKISSAKNADKLYNILDDDTWSMSNDQAWNEIDWISTLNSKLNDIDADITDDDAFKQCRIRKAIKECTHYDINNKVLTFTITLPKSRYKRHFSSYPATYRYPANMDAKDYYPQMTMNMGNMPSQGMSMNTGQQGLGPNSLMNTGQQGMSMNTGPQGLAPNSLLNTGQQGMSMNTWQHGMSMNSGQQGLGSNSLMNTGQQGISMNTGQHGMSMNTGIQGTYMNTGQQGMDPNSLMSSTGTNDVPRTHGGTMSGVGAMFGQKQQGNSKIDMNKMAKMNNKESYDAELSNDDAMKMIEMVGDNDPFNVRRLYGESENDDYITEMEGYDFNTKFEYGDMMGYTLWAKDTMGVDTFECINCDSESVSSAHVMDDDDEGSEYGDYMYYFDEHQFDFENEAHWNENNGDLSKCSLSIPGLHHKLCVDHDNGEYQIRFAAATNDEMDDTYYQLYGYDEYYYNNVLDGLVDDIVKYADDEDGDGDNRYDDTGESRRDETEKFKEIYNAYNDRRRILKRSIYQQNLYPQRMRRRLKLDDANYNNDRYDTYYDSGYDDNEYYTDAQALLSNLENELEDVLLSFEGDTDWDEISDVNDRDDGLQSTFHSMRKCRALQSVRICATMNDEKKGKHGMKVNIQIGRHKYHRSPFFKSSAYTGTMNELNRNNHANEQILDYDLNTNNAEKDALQQMHWIIDDGALDVIDDEWNDPNHFKPTMHRTYNGHIIVRKCRATICICQYINNPAVGDQKHPCNPALKADNTHTLNGDDVLSVPHILDGFLAPIHILHLGGSPMAPISPYSHILHLRAIPPPTLHIHPFRERLFQNPIGYRKHNHRIPWHKYRAFFHLMPPSKPSWLPQWMWIEVKQHMKSPKQTAADADIDDYYDSNQGGYGSMFKVAGKLAAKHGKRFLKSKVGQATKQIVKDVGSELVAQGVNTLAETAGQALGIPLGTVVAPGYGYRGGPVPPVPPVEYVQPVQPLPPVQSVQAQAPPRTVPPPPPPRTVPAPPPRAVPPPPPRAVPPPPPRAVSPPRTVTVPPPLVQPVQPAQPLPPVQPVQPQAPPRTVPPPLPRAPPQAPARTQPTAPLRAPPRAPPPRAPIPRAPPPRVPRGRARKRKRALMESHYYTDNSKEYEDEDVAILDTWFDAYNADEWVILDDTYDDFIEDNFDLLDFEDDSIWDEIIMNIKTLNGKALTKKCMNILGRSLCICEFIDWLNGKVIGGNTKHMCYSTAHKYAFITKQTINKMKTEHHKQHSNLLLKHALEKAKKHTKPYKKENNIHPVWLPQYFWHWLHYFPHVHRLHLNHRLRIPWISSAAYMEKDVKDDRFNGVMAMDNEYDYDDEYDVAHDGYAEYTKYDNDNEGQEYHHGIADYGLHDNDLDTYDVLNVFGANAEYDDDALNEKTNDFDTDQYEQTDERSLFVLNDTDDDNGNPYWILELIFLIMCSVGIVYVLMSGQKNEWMLLIETVKELNEERLNKRKYGFNMINVMIDTDRDNDSYVSDSSVDEQQKMVQQKWIPAEMNI